MIPPSLASLLCLTSAAPAYLFTPHRKAQLRVFHPDPAAYQSVLADVSQLTGITTMVLMATSK